MPASGSTQTSPSLQTRLNDVTFTEYHLFRADARIIPSNQATTRSGVEPRCE
jgi:hypothetical protein